MRRHHDSDLWPEQPTKPAKTKPTSGIALIAPELNANQLQLVQDYIKTIIGPDMEGCGNHGPFNLPSPLCSSGDCLLARAVNNRLDQQREQAGLL